MTSSWTFLQNIFFCKVQYGTHFAFFTFLPIMEMLIERLQTISYGVQSHAVMHYHFRRKKNPQRHSNLQSTCNHPVSPRPLDVNVCHLIRDVQLSNIKITSFLQAVELSKLPLNRKTHPNIVIIFVDDPTTPIWFPICDITLNLPELVFPCAWEKVLNCHETNRNVHLRD